MNNLSFRLTKSLNTLERQIRSKGFTYIEMCLVLTLFSVVITPFGMMYLINVKTRVAMDQIEKRTQALENVSTDIKREYRLSDEMPTEIQQSLEEYDYDVILYDLKEVPSSILPDNLLQILKSNGTFQLSDATLTLDTEDFIECQTHHNVTIEEGKIKVGETIVGLYLTIAKGNTSFNLKDNAKTFVVLTLILQDRQLPFTIKLINATEKPLIVQLQGDSSNIHFIIDDPNEQTTFVQDNQIMVKNYKIAKIQLSDKQNPSKQVTQTLFFEVTSSE